MKKLISILLAILMIFSCTTAIAFAADETEEEKETVDTAQEIADMVGVDFTNAMNHPDLSSVIPSDYIDAQGQYDLEQLLASDDLANVDFLGLNLNFLYKSQEPLIWTRISLSKADLALIYGNINGYISNRLKAKFLEGKHQYDLYTSKYATKICNYIGHLFFPDYQDQTISFSKEPTTKNNFYTTIASRSGFQNLVKTQWLDQSDVVNFKPLIYALGFGFEDLYAPEVDITKSGVVAPKLIKDIIEEQIIKEGPFAFFMNFINRLAYTYDLYQYDAVKAIFANQIQAGTITAAELKNLRGLLNMVFNFNKPSDTQHLQMLTPPTYRFITARNDSELFLYLLTYMNLVGIFKGNPAVINNYKEQINDSTVFNDTEKSRFITIMEACFESKIAELAPLNEELTYESINGIGDTIKKGLLGFFGRILNIITSMFDVLFKRIRAFV